MKKIQRNNELDLWILKNGIPKMQLISKEVSEELLSVLFSVFDMDGAV